MPTNSLSSDALPQSEEDAQKANEIIIAVAMIIMGGLFTFAGGDYFATVLCGIAFCWVCLFMNIFVFVYYMI